MTCYGRITTESDQHSPASRHNDTSPHKHTDHDTTNRDDFQSTHDQDCDHGCFGDHQHKYEQYNNNTCPTFRVVDNSLPGLFPYTDNDGNQTGQRVETNNTKDKHDEERCHHHQGRERDARIHE